VRHRRSLQKHGGQCWALLRHTACRKHEGGGNHSRRPMATTSADKRTQVVLRRFSLPGACKHRARAWRNTLRVSWKLKGSMAPSPAVLQLLHRKFLQRCLFYEQIQTEFLMLDWVAERVSINWPKGNIQAGRVGVCILNVLQRRLMSSRAAS